MNLQWIAAEHYRLHRIEEWPESPRKDAALAACQSSLQNLLRNHKPHREDLSDCPICLGRAKTAVIFEFPVPVQLDHLAA